MQDSPSSPEMLDSIISLLRERISPKLEGHDLYAVRVAINSLGIIKREIEQRPDAAAAERERLVDILGHEGTLDALNTELCEKIRQGDFTLRDKPVVDHLKQTVIDQVRIDQPRYSGLAHALKEK